MMRKNKKKKAEEGSKKGIKIALPEKTKRWIWGIFFLLVAVIFVLAFFEKAGIAGRIILSLFSHLIGKSIYFLPPILFLGGLVFFFSQYERFLNGVFLAILLFILAISGFFEALVPGQKLGGYFGYLAGFLTKLFGVLVTQIIFGGLFLISILIFWQLLKRPVAEEEREELEKKPSLIKRIFFAPKFKVREVEPVPVFPEKKGEIKKVEKPFPGPSPRLISEGYQLPPLDLLDSEMGQPSAGDIQQNSLIIKKTLEHFGIPVQMGQVNIGPTVTQYTLKPAEGIKLSKITSLSNDLALALASHPIRIEAPIPGKSLVGIEVPNRIRLLVRLRDLISHPSFQNSPSPLTFCLGRDVSGNPVYADLGKMPHLMVAGSTGTGKTTKADTFMFTERGMLTFEELCPLPLNSEIDFKIKLVTRDGIEETAKNYNNGICQFYKITTNRGYQIEVTAEHPLWVINQDGSCGWKPASLIKEGDYVAISRGPVLFGNRIDLSNFKPSEIKTYHRKISFPSKMTPQLAQFLGLLTADGGLSTERGGIHRVVYTQANPKLLSLYKKLLKELFGITQFIEKKSGSNPNTKAIDIEVNSIQLKEFLNYLGMKPVKAPQKEIPRAIREGPKEILVSYLRALFDNDGYSGEDSLEISLSSKKLLAQVQILLLNFGIISSLKEKKVKNYPQNEYFRLSIYGEDARKFIKEIGFLREEKYQKVKRLLQLKTNPRVDIIPHISSLLKKLGQKYLTCFARLTNQGWKYQSEILIPKYAFNSLTKYNSGERNPSYQALKGILDFYQPLSQELKYQELEKISQRNFYWDKVEKIERTSGIGYDFYVPGSDSFVGNGFVNHNTIFLNSLILSLLYRNSPETLRFILIDPKRVEFPAYNDLPHLLSPVIFDVKKAVAAIQWLIGEMERRFDLLSEAKARDISGYNEMAKKFQDFEVMPYIVLMIDELADLMAARGKEIEAGIVRIAQMARAVGIHLIVATQRPSVEVITGLIKANITSRVTFQVASQVDSRTILDMAGAEKLLGLGDLLFLSAEITKPRRIQGAFVLEKELKKVVNFIKVQNSKLKVEKLGERIFENSLAQNLGKALEIPEMELTPLYEGKEDPLYEEAKRIVIEAKKASASLLQRRLSIGYARAARLLDMLEERGVVGPGEGAKPRQVYIKTDGENNENEDWQKM